MKPTIKGIFVRSHIKAVEKERGATAVQDLERRFGKPVRFGSGDDVPISDEVRILELSLDILRGEHRLSSNDRAREAGRLHFRNFVTTPLARIVFSMFRNELKTVLANAGYVAEHVFKGVKFYAEDIGPTAVRITMENNDYPLEHFQGLFEEWLCYAEVKGTVTAEEKEPGVFCYVIVWEPRR